MFNYLISKSLIIALLISLFFNALLIGISKHLYDSKAEVVYSLKELEKTILEQQKAYELANKVCVIGEDISASFQKEKQNSDERKESDISKIDSIPKLGIISPKMGTTSVAKEATIVDEKATGENSENKFSIDIDSKLPYVLISLLSESCLRAKGSNCEHP